MAHTTRNKVLELFGKSTRQDHQWKKIIKGQRCPFTSTRCFKVRKSQPEVSIGSCTVRYGRDPKDIIICPNRLLERKQVFTDCLHLLTLHEPGNELHVIPEISIPGGSVDYFLASVKGAKVRDFVAIEFQTLDTTGTVWPERQRLLRELGMPASRGETASSKGFGMNWKMTAKTALIQLHHKVETLEHLGKRFVSVIQDHFLDYLQGEFNFRHLESARLGDSMHVHSYRLKGQGENLRLELEIRLSTDAAGVAECLGIQAETKMALEAIIAELEKRICEKTLLTLDARPIPVKGPLPTE